MSTGLLKSLMFAMEMPHCSARARGEAARASGATQLRRRELGWGGEQRGADGASDARGAHLKGRRPEEDCERAQGGGAHARACSVQPITAAWIRAATRPHRSRAGGGGTAHPPLAASVPQVPGVHDGCGGGWAPTCNARNRRRSSVGGWARTRLRARRMVPEGEQPRGRHAGSGGARSRRRAPAPADELRKLRHRLGAGRRRADSTERAGRTALPTRGVCSDGADARGGVRSRRGSCPTQQRASGVRDRRAGGVRKPAPPAAAALVTSAGRTLFRPTDRVHVQCCCACAASAPSPPSPPPDATVVARWTSREAPVGAAPPRPGRRVAHASPAGAGRPPPPQPAPPSRRRLTDSVRPRRRRSYDIDAALAAEDAALGGGAAAEHFVPRGAAPRRPRPGLKGGAAIPWRSVGRCLIVSPSSKATRAPGPS